MPVKMIIEGMPLELTLKVLSATSQIRRPQRHPFSRLLFHAPEDRFSSGDSVVVLSVDDLSERPSCDKPPASSSPTPIRAASR